MIEAQKSAFLSMSKDPMFAEFLKKHQHMHSEPDLIKNFDKNGHSHITFSWLIENDLIIAVALDPNTGNVSIVEARASGSKSDRIELKDVKSNSVLTIPLIDGEPQLKKMIDISTGATCYSQCMAECDCDPRWFKSYYICVASWSAGCLSGCSQR